MPGNTGAVNRPLDGCPLSAAGVFGTGYLICPKGGV